MKPRLLLLSYAFPPVALPEAPLSAKRMGNLPGYDVDVVCIRPFGRTVRADSSLNLYVAERFGRVERIAPSSALTILMGRKLGAALLIPDPLRLMNRRALAAALRMRPEHYAAIVTWSQWHSIHLVGLALKERFPNLPWIAHFSDPWAENPLAPWGPLLRLCNRRLEERVLSRADRLSFTSPETVALSLSGPRAAFAAKAFDLPHAFEPELYPPLRPRTEGPLLIRYIGNFYGRRSPEPLFRALGALARENPGDLSGVTVEIVGETARAMLETGSYRGLPAGLVTFRDPIPYRESLALMREADLLLVVDAPAPESVFLPSKLVDYIGAARPILGLTPRGAAARVIAGYGGIVANPADDKAAIQALRAGIALARAHRGKDFGESSFRNSFTAAHVGAKFGRVVDGLVRRGAE